MWGGVRGRGGVGWGEREGMRYVKKMNIRMASDS